MRLKRHFSKNESAEVQRYVPFNRTMRRFLLVLLLIIAPTISFFVGEIVGNIQKGKQLAEQQQLFELSEKLDKELRAVTHQRNQAQSTLAVTEQTIKSLRQDILQWREQYEVLNGKINRYRSVIESGKESRDIVIDKVNLFIENKEKPQSGSIEYYLNSSVVQYTLSNEKFRGRLSISISGVNQAGEKQTLEHKQLFKESYKLLGFRYFQHSYFRFTLPEEFKAEQLSIFISGTGLPEMIIQKYSWKSLLVEAKSSQSCQPEP